MFETIVHPEWANSLADPVPPPVAGEETGVPVDSDDVGMCLDALERLDALRAVDDVERRHEAAEVDELDADGVLAAVAATQRQVNLAQAAQLRLAAHWADRNDTVAHPYLAGRPEGRRGRETLVQPGGDGTPEFAEFAAAELGAALRVSTVSAGLLLADALDLRHRLPLLWEQTQSGEVKIWVARRVATRTRRLCQAAAARVDVKVAPLAATVPYGRLEKILDAAVLAADPERAATDTAAAEAERGVWVGSDTNHGVATMFAKADAPDLAAIDRSLNTLARAMTMLGDTDGHDIRRAKALGVLADPGAALELTRLANESIPPRPSKQPDNADSADGGQQGTDPRRPCDLGPATLYVHISRESLADDGNARVEDLGPVLLEQVRRWLGHRTVRIRPVIDMDAIPAVDCYEVPARMGEAVRLRTPADFFPFSSSLSRRGDFEHTVPFIPPDQGGPPGQTAMDNLAHTNRRPHRIKTHGRWTVTQPRSGVWIWRSPHGSDYLVDTTGTTALGKLGGN